MHRTLKSTTVLLLAVVALAAALAGTASAFAPVEPGGTSRSAGADAGALSGPLPVDPSTPSEISGLTYSAENRTIAASDSTAWIVSCPTGKTALFGGVALGAHLPAAEVLESRAFSGRGWLVSVHNDSGAPVTSPAWVACATVS